MVDKLIIAGTKKVLLQNIEKSKRLFPVHAAKDKEVQAGSKSTGVKSYLAFPNHESFFKHIQSEDKEEKRNFYEIIDGQQKSCMYWDIDSKDTNNSAQLLETLLVNLQQFLQSLGLEGRILTLSASIEVKTSYHFIVRGDWVTENKGVRSHLFFLFQDWLENRQVAVDLSTLDSSVYSSWQAFRTIYSTKLLQRRPLKPIAADVQVNPLDFFVTYVPEYSRVVRLQDLPGLEVADSDCKETKKQKKIRDKIKNAAPTSNDIDKELIKDLPNKYDDIIKEYVHDHSIEFLTKCIPNGGAGQPWVVWIGIGMAIHRSLKDMFNASSENGTNSNTDPQVLERGFKIYNEWSEGSEKYDKDSVPYAWKSFERNFREIGYNKGTLFRLAKLCQPDLFTLDYSAFEDFSAWTPWIQRYNNKRVLPYDENVKLCFEQSPMGSGKTYQLAKYIKEHNPSRVICLSPRQSYADNFTADMNEYAKKFTAEMNELLKDTGKEFVNYRDLAKSSCCLLDWSKTPYLVIQMESLYKVAIERFKPYDLLVVDEVESNLKTFSSVTMLTKIKSHPTESRLKKNLDTFSQLVTTSSKCIFADALLTNRTFNTINNISPFSKSCVQIRINEFQRDKKEAVKFPSLPVFKAAILKKLQNNKKIIVFWGSKRQGKEFEQTLKDQLPNKKVKFYHADADDALDKDLDNVNVEWANNVDCLMYTGKITVGVNFSIADYFDEMFVYAFAGGACAREIMQATMRVRATNSNRLNYCIDSRHLVKETPVTLRCLLAQTQYKAQQLHLLEDVYERGHLSLYVWEVSGTQQQGIPMMESIEMSKSSDAEFKKLPWTSQLWLYNQLEDNLSTVRSKQVLMHYLVLSGHELKDFDEPKAKQEGKQTKTIDPSTLYKNIPVCDRKDASALQIKVQRKEATDMEKLTLKKYFFDCQVKVHLLLDESTVQKVWECHLKHDFVKKVKCFARNETPDETFTLQRAYLEKLQIVLNIDHLFGTSTVSADCIARACQMVETDKHHISRVFDIGVGGIDTMMSSETKMKNLKSIFKETVFGTFTSVDRVPKGEGRKSKRVKTGNYQYGNQLTKKFKIDVSELVKSEKIK